MVNHRGVEFKCKPKGDKRTSMTKTSILAPVTTESAPEAVRPTLEKIRSAYGQVPALMAGMANSPVLLHGYLALSEQYDRGTLTAEERQYVLLAVSDENECRFCSAAHATILKQMLKAAPEVVDAVRNNRPTGDARRDALVALARAINTRRGQNVQAELDAFFASGFTEPQVAEVLVGIGLKAMSNTLDHLGHYDLGVFAAEAR
jgi:uncharacterized peroxidase-related enzyme